MNSGISLIELEMYKKNQSLKVLPLTPSAQSCYDGMGALGSASTKASVLAPSRIHYSSAERVSGRQAVGVASGRHGWRHTSPSPRAESLPSGSFIIFPFCLLLWISGMVRPLLPFNSLPLSPPHPPLPFSPPLLPSHPHPRSLPPRLP